MTDPRLATTADLSTAAAPITSDYKSETQRAYREVRTAITLLQQRWPAAFPEGPQQVRPLITGLVLIIAAELGWSHPYARAVLRTWKLRPAYCHAVLAHPVRFDLEGNPTDQLIDEKAREQARARLAAWARKRNELPPRWGERSAAPAVDHGTQQQQVEPLPQHKSPAVQQQAPAPPAKPQPRRLQASPPLASKPQPPKQKNPPSAPPAKPLRPLQPAPAWRPGDKVRWQGYAGTFLRETVDDQAEVLIGTRTYRVDRGELRST